LSGVLPLLFLIACSQGSESNAVASTPAAQVGSNEDVEELLSRIERDWADALVKGDVAFTEGLLEDDYVGTMSDGRRITKAQNLDNLRSGAFKSESMVVDGIKVRVLGDTAVVTLDQSEKSQFEGKDISGRSMWTDIFMRRDGKWQIVANHGSRVDESKK
jgi:hypothetical protein